VGNYREEPEEQIDRATGEVLEATATPVTDEQAKQPQPQQAIGGGMIAPPAVRAGDVINILEDGQLSYEMQQMMQLVAEQVREVAGISGGKAKGEVTLKLTFAAEGEGDALRVEGKITKKTPELPRRRSILWQDENGAFTTHPPRQVPMFGQQVAIRRVG
jgi:hypothetical protein